MIALMALVILGLWGFIVYKISGFLVKKFRINSNTKIIHPIIFLLIFCAPIADEIIGGFQFRSLCTKKVFLVVEPEKARGKTVVSQPIQYEYLSNNLIPISREYLSYKDKYSGEVLVGWYSLHAEGGWLARSLNILSSKKPYTFDGVCTPSNIKTILSDLELKTAIQ